ncbi:hypothetical protein RYX36_028297 [Vicia faba]
MLPRVTTSLQMIFKLHIPSTLEILPVALYLQYQEILVTVYRHHFLNASFAHSGIHQCILKNGKYQRTGSGRVSAHDTNDASMASQDTNFFCPATYAQFYLDQNPPFPHNGGRLSVSKDSDAQSTDEIITTSQYVEISDVMDDSFTMMPLTAGKSMMEQNIEPSLMKGFKAQETQVGLQNLKCLRLDPNPVGKQARNQVPVCDGYEAEENAITALKRALAALNTHLASNTYLVAHSVTLADIIMITNLYFCFTKILVKSFTSQYPHVERYFWTLVNHPNFREN